MNQHSPDLPPPAVFITGASTGIGKACALSLSELGWRVFAGVRKESDADALLSESDERIAPVYLDVTDEEGVNAAAQAIKETVGDDGIQGLVNNAGVVVAGPLECLPLQEIKRQFEINVIGQLAVTQAFLPLIRQGEGRIILMSSIAGRSSIPFTGPYCASKFALEALGDALRLELRPWKIPVVLIEPGIIETPIWEKSSRAAEENFSRFPPKAMKLYGENLQRFQKLAQKVAKRSAPVEVVVKVVERALTVAQPRTRYTIPFDTKLRLILEALPTELRDFILAKAMGIK